MRVQCLVCIFLLFISPHTVLSNSLEQSLEDAEGNKYYLSDYIGKGKWVIVNVWGIDCPYCRKELGALIDFHGLHHNKDAIVLGLTLHWPTMEFPNSENLFYFALENSIQYPLLMVDGELASQLIGQEVNMIPLTFFYNPDGDLTLRLNGVVTRDVLESAINQEKADYQLQWAEEVPELFKP